MGVPGAILRLDMSVHLVLREPRTVTVPLLQTRDDSSSGHTRPVGAELQQESRSFCELLCLSASSPSHAKRRGMQTLNVPGGRCGGGIWNLYSFLLISHEDLKES